MVKVSDLPKFDAAKFLDTPEMQAEYLSAALEERDPAGIRDALRTLARARGMTETAKAAGISRHGLYKALGGGGNPEFSTVLAIVKSLGLKLSAQPEAKRPTRKRGTAA